MIQIGIYEENVVRSDIQKFKKSNFTIPELEDMKSLLSRLSSLDDKSAIFEFRARNLIDDSPWFHVPGVGDVKTMCMTVNGRFVTDNDQIFIHDGSYILNYSVFCQTGIEAINQVIEDLVAEGHQG